MAGSRGESWWQPPKEFDASALGDTDQTWDDADEEPIGEDPGSGPSDEVAEDDTDAEDDADDDDADEIDDDSDDDADDIDDDSDDDADEDELDDDRATVPVGWTIPTGDVVTKDSSNRRFFVGVAAIVIATTIGVLFALTLGDSDGGDETLEAPVTSVPLDVRGATTIRPGGLTPLCEAEQTRLQQAEEAYQRGSTAGQFTDMSGLVSSGKLAAPSTLFVVTNEEKGDPSVVSFAGTSAREYLDYLVLPIPDGPCDTT